MIKQPYPVVSLHDNVPSSLLNLDPNTSIGAETSC